MTKSWRFILDDACDGYYNMAADESLLFHYPFQKIPTLRIYGWKSVFVSLGYRQKPQDVLASKADIPFVRRITGGASILHDQELTYCLVCSRQDLNLPVNVKESYKIICSFIVNFYSSLSLKAQFAKDVFMGELGQYSNFCFSACEEFDLVVKGKKIGGNAQKRRKDLIFQQGSIPQQLNFEKIRCVIKLASAIEGRVAALDNYVQGNYFSLQKLLADSFCSTFGVIFSGGCLNEKEKQTCQDLIKEKYSTYEWNFNRA